jgi:hypothetical protein
MHKKEGEKKENNVLYLFFVVPAEAMFHIFIAFYLFFLHTFLFMIFAYDSDETTLVVLLLHWHSN